VCEAQGLRLHDFPWNREAREAGLLRNAAYVVRPDGHVAIMDRQADSTTISAYFDLWKPKSIKLR
jgi:hypothetical protein